MAQDRIPYLAYPFSHPGTSYAFEDGYLVSPWGRGNLWYRGIAETDIWEGMAAVKALVRVNESRQYLCGHSMGGYGAWHIAHRSADTWAALGVHAGALQYDAGELNASVAAELRDLPTYFVVGTSDGLLGVNQGAYTLLQNAGNPNLAFVTFPGGHDYRQVDVEAMYLWLRRFEGRSLNASDGSASSSAACGGHMPSRPVVRRSSHSSFRSPRTRPWRRSRPARPRARPFGSCRCRAPRCRR